jgi:ankyrin repeat protein
MRGLVRIMLTTAALSLGQFAGASLVEAGDARTGEPALLALADPGPGSLRLPRQSARHPLHGTALQDDVAGIASWVGRGIPVDTRDEEGRTPLMVAAAFGNVAAAEALIGLGADSRARDDQGEAAIHFAARAGMAPMVDLLIAKGVDPDFVSSPRSATALHYAATFGHERVVRLLVARGADPDAIDIEGIRPLQYASRRNRSALVAVFIELGARPQTLHDAVNADDVVEAWNLIRLGANVDAPDLAGPPLNHAAAKGSLAMVRILVDAGADLEASGDPASARPLHMAAMRDHPEIARFLISRGADPDSRDDWGRTPLMVAATFGTVEVADTLLSGGADPTVKDDVYGDTAIHHAAIAGQLDVVALLLAEGIPIDLPSGHEGESALHYAAYHANFGLVEFLVEQGADLQRPDDTGATPLRYALICGNDGAKTAILLRRLGANE